MSKRLKKVIVILSTLCVVFTTAVVPIFATATDTTSHRPTYPLAPYEGNMSINLSNDFGVNREDVYTLTFDSNSNIPLPSLGDSVTTSCQNIIQTKQTSESATDYKGFTQILHYVPDSSLGVNSFMVNTFYATPSLKTYLSSYTRSSTSVSFHIDDLYIPYKGNRPNLYFLPSVSLDFAGINAQDPDPHRYIYYSYVSYNYDANGKLTATPRSYTVLCTATDDGILTFPLIPYARPSASTGGAPQFFQASSDLHTYKTDSNIFYALQPTYDSAIPLIEQSTLLNGVIRIGNLNVTVLVPPAQKQYIDDDDFDITYSSVYYKPSSGSATNSKQNALATAYNDGLVHKYAITDASSWFGWIVDSVSGFLNIQLIGNLTIGTIFGLVFSIPLLLLILRSFDGG